MEAWQEWGSKTKYWDNLVPKEVISKGAIEELASKAAKVSSDR